jgi:Ca-activated chloride channel homolog
MASPIGRELAVASRTASPARSHAVHPDAVQPPRRPSVFAPLLLLLPLLALPAFGQESPLDQVHVNPPPAPATARAADPSVPLTAGATLRSGIQFRVDTNLVLVPLTVTDPMDRLVTGLEKQNFAVMEDGHLQAIRTFAAEDAPVSIGVILDLSGSMSNKVVRARGAVLQFMKTSNPQDEFFVIGFNDRPQLITDFTSSVDDVEARLATVEAGRRTALLDAIYFGLEKMKQAKYDRKALLVVSDGGDNNSR